MTKTTIEKTAPLTTEQQQMLNQLAQASTNLRTYLEEVIKRAKGELERATEGHNMSGFSGDLFGQSRYQADAAAVRREALITACFALNCSREAVMAALLPSPKRYGYEHPRFFQEGERFAVNPALHEE